MTREELKEAADKVSDALNRVWGLSYALFYMSQHPIEGNTKDLSSFTNTLDEISGAMRDAISPALDSCSDLLTHIEREGGGV